MASSLFSDRGQQRDGSDEIRFTRIPQERSIGSYSTCGHCAYVNDLVISGSGQMVKEFISMIQEEFTLSHIKFLTPENPVELLSRTIKGLKNGNITVEFSQKFIDELRFFEVKSKVTTTRLRLQALQKIRRLSVTKSLIKFQVSCWKTSLDGSAQGRPQASSQGALKIAHQSAGSGHQKFHSVAQVYQSDKRFRLCHGTSASSQESRRQVPSSDCQLLRFRLGRLSKIKEVNEWFIGFSVQCQSSINQHNSGFNWLFFSRE